MNSIRLVLYIIMCIHSLVISSYDINFFEQKKKLFYVNAMNDDNGDIYFEFWGEDDTNRYFISKKFETEENININGNSFYSINTYKNFNYHESIIVNYNNNVNILSMNSKTFDYINFQDESFTFKLTTNLIGENNGSPSYRSNLIKLKDGKYLSSIILKGSLSHKLYITIFDLESNNINGFKAIAQIDKIIGYMNSTSCFQTESEYIQCSFSNAIPSNYFTVGIFDLNLNEQETIHFGYLRDYTFTKIFHIKGEIGAYIFFDDRDNNVPKLYLKELNQNKNGLNNILSNNVEKYIVLNNEGKYELDYGLFASDAIKIDDLQFVVILTISNSNDYDLLICLCDFNIDYTGIRIRYYPLTLSSYNIKIQVNLRAFNFRKNFGLLFYDSNSEYPGYIFFNYPIIKGEDKIDWNTFKINLFENTSSYTFSFSENIELINNIYSGQIKIKIFNFTSPSISGVLLKTSISDISEGDIINFEAPLIFEPESTGAYPGEYLLEFSPIVEEIDSSTEKYGDYQESDFEEIWVLSKFNLIYNVKCHEKCEACTQLDLNTNAHCIKCKFPYNFSEGECKIICNDYIYINDGNNTCNKNCTEGRFIYKKNEEEKYCLSSCIYNNKILFQDENEAICYNDCSESINNHIYLYQNQCMSYCPDNYIPDLSKNLCVPNLTIESETVIIESSTYIDKIKECYINIDELINDYRRKMNIIEIKELKQCSMIYYCYSSKTDMDALIAVNQNLVYMDFSKCRISLINENILDEDSELLIIGKLKLINQEKLSIDDFEYEVYFIDGTKLDDLSICQNSKLVLSSPIVQEEDYKKAISLSEQGYDIFNLSSSFYYDICLSSYINDSDLTLSLRQKEIMPDESSICLDGCIYNGVNLTSKRISCLCDIDYFEKNNKSEDNQIEEVEENFFSYILNMVNYKITICYKLLFRFKNYFYNYGFYSSIGTLLIILLLCFIYCIMGKKSIKIQ